MKSEHINSHRAGQYLRGELGREEVLRIQRHLVHCALCSDALEGMAQELELEENPSFVWEKEGKVLTELSEPDAFQMSENVYKYVSAYAQEFTSIQESEQPLNAAMREESGLLRQRFSLQPAAWAIAATVALFLVFALLTKTPEEAIILAENSPPIAPKAEEPQPEQRDVDESPVPASSPLISDNQQDEPNTNALQDRVNQTQPGVIVSERGGEPILMLADDGRIPQNSLGLPEGGQLPATDTLLLASDIISLLPGDLEPENAMNEIVAESPAENAPAAGYNLQSRVASDSELAKKTEQKKQVMDTEITYNLVVLIDEEGEISAVYPNNFPMVCRDYFAQWLEENSYRLLQDRAAFGSRSILYPVKLICP